MNRKKIVGLLCGCLMTMSMFSVIGLSAEAAQCTHPAFIVGIDALKEPFQTDDGHYERRGTVHECPTCKYSYWENVYTIKVGDHTWVWNGAKFICTGCRRERN